MSFRIAQTFVLAVIASALFLPQLAHAASPPGLVAAYSFDEKNGSTVADASGHGNTGTISNARRTSTAKHGSALTFNGSNSMVTIQPSASLALATGTTFEAWVRPTSATSGWRSVIFKEQPKELVYALYAYSDRGLPAGIAYTGGGERTAYGSSALPTSTWTHLAVTHDGTNARLYVNGTLVSTVATTGAKPTTNGLLRIGGNGVWNEWFQGQIDDVRVYDRPLTAAEIGSDLGTAVGGTPAPPASDTISPSTPTNLAASGATQNSVNIGWSAATDNVGVAGYGLYRDGNSTGSTTSTSTTFTGLACGTSYSFAVDAVDNSGNRSMRGSVTAATAACPPAPDTQAPTTPGGAAVTGSSATSVSLGWNAASDNVGVAGYGLYRNGTATTSTTLTSTSFTGLACGTSYTFAVDAFDDAGNRSAKASVTASTSACPPDAQAPTAPGSVFVTGSSTTSVSLSWNASFDNVAVTGYGLYRNGTLVTTSGTTSATFGSLACGTSYTFAIDAYDAAGNRSAKASVTAATAACAPAPDTQAPTTPAGVAVTGSSATSVSLSWNAATDNVGVTGYGLYRNGTLTGTAGSTSTTFSGLTCGTSYTLGADAYDAAGNRSQAASISASTAACSTPPPPTGSANVYVSPSGSDSTCARSDSSKPCASFNKAFSIAQSGDVVEVAAGAYGSQSIAQSSKTAAVTVRPAAGATVTVASLSVNASHFHIEGIVGAGSGQTRGDLSICSSECNPGLVDVLIKDGGFRSAFIRASGVTVQGGDYGGFDACNSNAPEDGFRFWGGSAVAQPTNDVVDGATIHDITSGSGNTCQGTSHAGYHVDCMQNQGGQNITIRNSTFYNCPTSDIQMEPFSGATIGNVTIENNFFGPTECCNSIVLGTTSSGANCSSLVIRYNVLYNTPNPDQCGTGGNGVQTYGNIFPSSVSCSNDSFDHNVFAASGGSTCGTAAKRCTPAWVSTPPSSVGGAKPNAHLLATDTCAKAAGDASRYPTTDIDGQSRPQGSTTPDAGADEVG